MPRFVIPRKSGVHRIAAIALFRALLTQCRAVALKDDARESLQNVVRNRFKSYQHVHSKPQLSTIYAAGYTALELLDSSVAGDETSLSQVQQILASTPKYLKRRPRLAPLSLKSENKHLASQTLTAKDSILARPRPSVAGIRRVPVLVIANDIPFLRIKKPQPKSLSIYLRSRVKQRQSRHDLLASMESFITTGLLEDQWDDLVLAESKGVWNAERSQDARVETSVSWATEFRATARSVNGYLAVEHAKAKEMERRLTKIVTREKQLAEKERDERISARRKRSDRRDSIQDHVPEDNVKPAPGLSRHSELHD